MSRSSLAVARPFLLLLLLAARAHGTSAGRSSGGGGSSSGGGAAVVEVNKSPGSGKAAKPRKTLGQRVGKAAGKVAKMLAIKS